MEKEIKNTIWWNKFSSTNEHEVSAVSRQNIQTNKTPIKKSCNVKTKTQQEKSKRNRFIDKHLIK